jgi:hypothetical protein
MILFNIPINSGKKGLQRRKAKSGRKWIEKATKLSQARWRWDLYKLASQKEPFTCRHLHCYSYLLLQVEILKEVVAADSHWVVVEEPRGRQAGEAVAVALQLPHSTAERIGHMPHNHLIKSAHIKSMMSQ